MIKKKILLVDDSPVVINVLRSLLEETGYEVTTAENGRQAIDRASEAVPDIAVLDTILPDTDGFEVCRSIRRLPSCEAVKIIVMTGSIDAIDAVKARRMGADDYVVKTANFDLLLNAINQ